MKFQSQLPLALLALASCGPQRSPQEPPKNSATPALPAARAPERRTSLAEPKGPIDPKSLEAAGQIVQHYGALIEEKRFAEAAKLWSDAEAASNFAKELDQKEVHLEIGPLGETEGAAGSIYTSVPVVFYGEGFRRRASIILRRVNDVPGSSEAQRRWHIERIEWEKSD